MKRTLFLVAGAGAAAAAAVPVVGSVLWNRESADIACEILSRSRANPGPVAADRFADVPAPVARFFRRTLGEKQPIIRSARLQQTGEFWLNGSWRPMRASQIFSATAPAFMWDARISAAPFVPVYVRDSYVFGRGTMRVSMLALYPIVNQTNLTELNAGALLRYLGEAAWFPTRLLPGNGLTWRPLDEDCAEATLTDGATSVSLQFRFDTSGDIIELFAPERYREVNGTYVLTPWRVRALGQGVNGGLRMMTQAVAEWMLPEGPLPYWRGTITEAHYQY
jgi:hypothetical protein